MRTPAKILAGIVAMASLPGAAEKAASFDIAGAAAPAGEEPYARIKGNPAGEEREFEIAPGVRMKFCWCPAGEFVIGSPKSE